MFGRRKRDEEAAEAARESERRVLFAKLAERPEHICPFLGLAGDRTGYVDGINDEHRCFAFGDPAPISAEQQTRVCQERGYGNCPRYLRGVLVIPTEELEALRRPRPAAAALPPPPPPAPAGGRRRRAPVAILLALIVLLGAGVAAFVLMGRESGVATGSPTPIPTAPASASASAEPSVAPASAAPESVVASPTPEPTPTAGDAFAFYEVSVGPQDYLLYSVADDGSVEATRRVPFAAFSFARAQPLQTNGQLYWETVDGDLAGWSYQWPSSGEFRIRAVFLSADGQRRSVYLEEEELTVFPEATPAP